MVDVNSDEYPDRYPDYDTSEVVADGVIHMIGVIAAVAAIAAFLALNIKILETWTLTGLAVYWAGLLTMLLASFCYHMTPREELRPRFRRADHAAIFLKIAGTYTPFVIVIGSAFGYVVLLVVWLLALVGAALRLKNWQPGTKLNVSLYLGLGWLSILLIWSIFQTSTLAGICAVSGGLLYTIGVVFLHWESLKFSNAIWHGFVVVASAFYFAAIWLSVMAANAA